MNKRRILAVSFFLALLLGACARHQEATPAVDATRESTSGATAAARATPLPGQTPAPVGGMAEVGVPPQPSPPPQVYVVQSGDTLSAIAARFGCSVDALARANTMANPNALSVGQVLQIPSTEMETGPTLRLLPNSEFVYGPAYVYFDTTAFVTSQSGYLAGYYETVSGETLTGPQIVDLVAHHYSVGPRLLLAIMELRSGWVTNPGPTTGAAMGYTGSGWDRLSQQLAWAADALNKGYYDWRGRGVEAITWPDGTATQYASSLNAATAGIQYFFSLDNDKGEWLRLVGDGPDSFLAVYQQLFGEPSSHAIEPLIPATVTCPELSLPWAEGELWYYTGGPHGAWSDGSAWAAIDAVPDEGYLGCQAAAAWARAAAPGLIIYSHNGEVMVDLDGDGHEQTGWVLFYLHVATDGRVPVGTHVDRGDPIGHPSCEGGFSQSTHLHFARKYNGEWIAADGPLPLVLSGWRVHAAHTAYEGTITRGSQERTACECREPEFNGLVGER
ncbi:MAG: LysM peptidoglycan-binding domain-containing protein [Anaerolineae bacterium]|nr:LysM peptidoglycan-binding domain-containing protein [Anaerolineae bacterium]